MDKIHRSADNAVPTPRPAAPEPVPAATNKPKAIGVQTTATTAETQAAQAKPGLVGGVMETAGKFSDDDGMTQAAALAFYTGLAIAPLLTVIVWIAQLVFKYVLREDAKGAVDRVMEVAVSVVGPEAAAPIRQLIDPASKQVQSGMTLTGILSILFLAFTASSVLAQLQASLNLIWRVKPDPNVSGIVTMIRKRIFSFGMLFTILFLLMVSMVVSVAITSAFSGEVEQQKVAEVAQATTQPKATVMTTTGPVTVPIVSVAGADVEASTQAHASTTSAPAQVTGSPEEAAAATRAAATQLVAATQAVEEAKETRLLAQVVNIVVSLIVATGVFMLLFTYLPDARVPWKDTFFGAVLTAVLFIVGRSLLGWYLGRGSYETSYGAAIGSFVVLLVWVYYTSIIIFLGTEATQVYARRHGHDPKPEEHAVKTERIERTLPRTDA